MTGSLPQDIRQAFGRFVTCEYTTAARRQPITWPVIPFYRDGDATIDVSTGLGYPKKADDARANRRVSLLFSDPTGSGIESGIQVLVQGTAVVDEEDLEANRRRYSRELRAKLPRSRVGPPPLERVFGWYYTRIYVHVRPERVFVWPDGDISRRPIVHDSHLEEVRSGHTEEPPQDHGRAAGGAVAWGERVEELGRRYEAAVLTWLAPDGFPLSVRVPVSPNASERRIEIGAEPAGLPLLEGRACLAAHRHPPDFSWQENFQLRGDLVEGETGWSLVPHRIVGGFEAPAEPIVSGVRRNLGKAIRAHRTARRRLRARSRSSVQRRR